MKKIILLITILLLLVACKVEKKQLHLDETSVQNIKITSPLADRKAEISGLAWFGDNLIILPQYPSRFGSKDAGALFAISKKQLDEYFSSENKQAITPLEIPFDDSNLSGAISGFEGYESICFIDDNIYLTIESSPDKMLGYLVKGHISLSEIKMDSDKLAKIEPEVDIPNACYETSFVYKNNIVAIFEGNGTNINHNPTAKVYDRDLNFLTEYSFPNIEYRITDATAVIDDNFYVINYFWPGDAQAYQPAKDLLKEKFGAGKTHSENDNVERILKMSIAKEKINLANTPPTYLQLLGNNEARNWEGIVRYKKGFIIATDKYPKTILAFVKQMR